MGFPHSRAASARRLALIGTVAAAMTVTATAGCSEDAPTTAATSQPATPPVSAGASDYCALATSILIESGLMVDGRIIPQLEETLDQFKIMVDLSLAARDQLLAGLPVDVRSALVVELDYFQALKDSDFTGQMPIPGEAMDTVNSYGEATCGFDFEP